MKTRLIQFGGQLEADHKINVSGNSKPANPPGQPQGNFLKGRIPHPRAQEKCQTPQKKVLKPHPRAIIFKNPAKKTTTHEKETEIYKNSTEMLICLEILKQ